MSETTLESRRAAHRRPLKAWFIAAVLFVFGVRLLATRDE